jgi:hypothetical protein
MADPAAETSTEQGSEAEQLRTVAFRMREIQRLLAVRVEQENRRLEAEGLEPVEESRFLEAVEGEP